LEINRYDGGLLTSLYRRKLATLLRRSTLLSSHRSHYQYDSFVLALQYERFAITDGLFALHIILLAPLVAGNAISTVRNGVIFVFAAK